MVTLTIGDFTVKAELAVTPEQLTIGLSNRDFLPQGEGLLLVLPKEGRIPITMKDMRFPLDILFFNSFLRLISIRRLRPGIVFNPIFSWHYALETNSDNWYIEHNDLARITDAPSSPSSSLNASYPSSSL